MRNLSLCLTVACVAGGCLTETRFIPEHGNPIIQAVLVTGVEPQEPVSGLSLIYGVVMGLNRCDESNPLAVCPAGFSCQDGSCVDGNGQLPDPPLVPTQGYEIRIVTGDLLDGKTVEHFACSCVLTGNCTPGREYSSYPFDCSSCEGGTCADQDKNDLPDIVAALPGLATVTCGSFRYTAQPGDEEYDPSGNLFPSSVSGADGYGPAIVLRPVAVLPSDSDCDVELSSTVRTKGGEPIEAPSRPVRFHTAP